MFVKMKVFTLKNSLFFLTIILVSIQFLPLQETNVVSSPSEDLFFKTIASAELKKSLKSACYDCHSNQTKRPWFSKIAPFSFWINHHIKEGKEHLNFSIWNTYSNKKADHKIEECIEEMEKNKMPLSSYALFHTKAKLTREEKKELINYFKKMINSGENDRKQSLKH